MCDTKEQDLYAVLGASPSDSVQQLRHRYQQLALQVTSDLPLIPRSSPPNSVASGESEEEMGVKIKSGP